MIHLRENLKKAQIQLLETTLKEKITTLEYVSTLSILNVDDVLYKMIVLVLISYIFVSWWWLEPMEPMEYLY